MEPQVTPVRVATYTRISTDEEHQPYSLEAQAHRLGSYIESQDQWQLVRRFTDQMTGSVLERPGLERALAEGRAKRYDLLLVYRVDRLSRSVRGLAQILDELDRAGVTFRSATEPFDTGTPAGRMMVQMLGVFAEFERATMIDRVVAGMERKAARGGWNGGLFPFGYQVDSSTGALKVHDEQALIVRQIFDLYLKKRMGSRAIAAWLNRCGHRTNYGKPWSHRTVLIVLRNRTYLGEIFFRGVHHVAPHPALVEAETFEAAQHLAEERGEDLGKRRINGSDYLLSGLIRCMHCGRRYIGAAAHGRSARYTYYTCYSRNRYGTRTCAAENLPAGRLEEAVVAALLEAYADHDLVDAAIAEARRRAADSEPHHQEELAGLESEIKRTEAGIDRYFAAFEAGTMTEKVCAPRLSALSEKLGQLQGRRAELLAMIEPEAPASIGALQLQQVRTEAERILSDGPLPQRKALLQELVAEIRVEGRDSITPVFRVPDPPVRVLDRVVGRGGLEPPTSAVAGG